MMQLGATTISENVRGMIPAKYQGPAQEQDVAVCRGILAEGSKSFAMAGKLLPARIRGDVAVVYAFCRVADDAIDESDDPSQALKDLASRLDGIYGGKPWGEEKLGDNAAVDRALSAVVAHYALPRAVFDGLLEGFHWDATGRHYQTEDELLEYSVRVASTVGVLMTLLMGERRPDVLRRACDLGVAMQLTNIARDVGEDARNGRVYIPEAWLQEEDLSSERLKHNPVVCEGTRRVTKRLLDRADRFYDRADAGVSELARDCRIAIRGARLIYAEIGREIEALEYDSISQRAYTSVGTKLRLLGQSLPSLAWERRVVFAEPLAQAEFLISSVTGVAQA